MKVAITGVSGYLGQQLLRHFETDDNVEQVVGIDIVEPAFVPEKLKFRRLDIRDPDLVGLLDGVTVLVHLGFVFNPIHDESLMSDINVNGTRNVLAAVAAAGVRRVVYASSMTAYGAHPDNDYPLTESSPLRGNADFSYALHKLEVERHIAQWRDENPEVKIAVLRMAVVMGPDVDNFVSRSLEAPRVTTVSGYSPSVQLLHQDDAVGAIAFAIEQGLDGVYNVAADGELGWDEVLQIAGKKEIAIPEPAVFPIGKVAWKLGLSEVPPGEMRFLMHRWVMSNEKLKEAGFAPLHSNREALAEAVESNRGWVSLGAARVPEQQYHQVARAVAALLLIVILAVLAFGMRDEQKKVPN